MFGVSQIYSYYIMKYQYITPGGVRQHYKHSINMPTKKKKKKKKKEPKSAGITMAALSDHIRSLFSYE